MPRTNNTRNAKQIEINVNKKNKLLGDISIGDYQSFEINVSVDKTAQQVASDIKRRILESEQFITNEALIAKRVSEDREYRAKVKANEDFMSKSGLIFEATRNKQDNEAKFWEYQDKECKNLTRIAVKARADIEDCAMELSGLTKEQWEQIFPVIKSIVNAHAKKKGKK